MLRKSSGAPQAQNASYSEKILLRTEALGCLRLTGSDCFARVVELHIRKRFYSENGAVESQRLRGSDCFTRVVELHRLRMLHIRNGFYSEMEQLKVGGLEAQNTS